MKCFKAPRTWADSAALPKQLKKDMRFGAWNIDLREIGLDGVNWIWLAQDRVRWRDFVCTVMNLRVP
jgi:hypothetical protein